MENKEKNIVVHPDEESETFISEHVLIRDPDTNKTIVNQRGVTTKPINFKTTK